MSLTNRIMTSVLDEKHAVDFQLNIIVTTADEGDGKPYFVAQCLELPGCVSDGTTLEETRANIDSAVRSCLEVLFEDCLHKVLSQTTVPHLINTRVVDQTQLRVTVPAPCLAGV